MLDPEPNSDFLEDLSNLQEDLKHPTRTNKTNIDDLDSMEDIEDADYTDELDEFLNNPEEKAETELVVQEKTEQPLVPQNTGPIASAASPSSASTEEIQNYVLSQCQDIIQKGKETLEQLQDTVINTCDGKAINGYATLLASLGKVLDTANSIGLEKSRIKSTMDLENLKHSHKTQLKGPSGPTNVTNNAIIVGGREEIMKMLNGQKPIPSN